MFDHLQLASEESVTGEVLTDGFVLQSLCGAPPKQKSPRQTTTETTWLRSFIVDNAGWGQTGRQTRVLSLSPRMSVTGMRCSAGTNARQELGTDPSCPSGGRIWLLCLRDSLPRWSLIGPNSHARIRSGGGRKNPRLTRSVGRQRLVPSASRRHGCVGDKVMSFTASCLTRYGACPNPAPSAKDRAGAGVRGGQPYGCV